MRNIRKKQFVKHLLYIVFFLVVFVLQGTPRFLEFWGSKPFPLIALAVAVAMFEGEFIGGIYGAFAGLLCDTAAFSTFGFNGIMLFLLCLGIGLLTQHLLQPHLGNNLLFTGIATFVMRNLQFLFTYGIFGYPGISVIYLRQVLLASVFTVVISPLLYYPTRKLYNTFQVHSP